MEDLAIIELYFERNESAIQETSKKYGSYCTTIAHNILNDIEDAKECVNDTYLRTWNSIPPTRPTMFRLYLGKICRNLSLDLWKQHHAKKRVTTEMTTVLSELEYCIADHSNVMEQMSEESIAIHINNFLRGCSKESRILFVRRYYYADSVKAIAKRFKMSESKVKSSLFRTRKALRNYLEKEGVVL